MTKEGSLHINKTGKLDNDITRIVIIPFCDDTPLFLSASFFEKLDELQNLKDDYVIFPFYVKTFYRKQMAGIIVHNGKIESLFGEPFSKKSGIISTNGCNINIVFYYDLYNLKYDFSPYDHVFGFDDEALDNEKYVYDKLSSKLLFFSPNSKALSIAIKKGKIFSKKYKKLL